MILRKSLKELLQNFRFSNNKFKITCPYGKKGNNDKLIMKRIFFALLLQQEDKLNVFVLSITHVKLKVLYNHTYKHNKDLNIHVNKRSYH